MEEITEPSDTATNQNGGVREKVATCGEGPFLTDKATRNEGPEDREEIANDVILLYLDACLITLVS